MEWFRFGFVGDGMNWIHFEIKSITEMFSFIFHLTILLSFLAKCANEMRLSSKNYHSFRRKMVVAFSIVQHITISELKCLLSSRRVCYYYEFFFLLCFADRKHSRPILLCLFAHIKCTQAMCLSALPMNVSLFSIHNIEICIHADVSSSCDHFHFIAW